MLVGAFSYTVPYAIYGGHGTIRVVEEPLEVSRGTLQHVAAYRDVYQCGKPYLYCRGRPGGWCGHLGFLPDPRHSGWSYTRRVYCVGGTVENSRLLLW
ncbi:Piso0_003905 [Millerozyma farinosa CBS 7064]|uniref:Piso0_003905 protein n=1 Tax=Pichia sorbitophila (strain ATCC MYA-4447 / BCRC 22081 / CBS 7064 / NBRC 10061 / NRRL Y-12695) TaxID=559304 RepID=G8Y6Y1_PICSO|nr:Piso0_003905 [Millerozyma farinosa CBS 7064]CCE84361.1 Piso0_003905 [Millerozyma farinosa CBS 7064]